MELHLIPSGYERSLPPGAQTAVRHQRRRLARSAWGRVLDLGGADAHADLWPANERVTEVVAAPDKGVGRWLQAQADDGERFDTVFSVLQLAAAGDISRRLRAIHSLLGPEGHLLFVEPARLHGTAGRAAQRLVSTPLGATAGWRADIDVPARIRANELSIIDIARPRVRTVQWWISALVVGRARRHRPRAAPESKRAAEAPPEA